MYVGPEAQEGSQPKPAGEADGPANSEPSSSKDPSGPSNDSSKDSTSTSASKDKDSAKNSKRSSKDSKDSTTKDSNTKDGRKLLPRAISTLEGAFFAKQHNLLYVETSAKEGWNVVDAFEQTARQILERVERGEFERKKPQGVSLAEGKTRGGCC